MHDLQSLRQIYADLIRDFLHQIDLNEQKFAKEREFFLKQSLKDQEVQGELKAKIADLERRLQDEKNYATDLYI